MLFRILKNSFLKRPQAILLVLLAITLGGTVATAFLGIQAEMSHKMARELRSYGANIVVEPADPEGRGSLREADLPKIKTVFWKYNITGFAPFLFQAVEFEGRKGRHRGVLTGTWFQKELQVPGEGPTVQGVKIVAPWWSLQGDWPASPDEAVIGAALAQRTGVGAGGEIAAHRAGKTVRFKVVGVVTTGGYEEEQLFAPLASVQAFLGKPGSISRVLVSALTVPIDDFGSRDPSSMSKDEYEKWYCTAYVTSVAKNIEEVMGGSRAKPIWQIASAEGAILRKLNLVMLLLTVIALASSAVAVSTSLTASMAERSREIALMKAIGADRFQIGGVFLGETLLISLAGGIFGYLAGGWVGELISRMVFNSHLTSPAWLLPVALGAALSVALFGSIWPLRRALLIEPVKVLKG